MFLLDQAAANSMFGLGDNPWGTVMMYGLIVVMFVAMYFLILRPQRKKQKEEEQMRSSVEVGDDVTTIGGIVGKVIAVRDDDETFVLETGSDKTRIRMKKWAISSIDTPEKQPKKDDKKAKEEKKDNKKDNKKDKE